MGVYCGAAFATKTPLRLRAESLGILISLYNLGVQLEKRREIERLLNPLKAKMGHCLSSQAQDLESALTKGPAELRADQQQNRKNKSASEFVYEQRGQQPFNLPGGREPRCCLKEDQGDSSRSLSAVDPIRQHLEEVHNDPRMESHILPWNDAAERGQSKSAESGRGQSKMMGGDKNAGQLFRLTLNNFSILGLRFRKDPLRC